MSEVSGRDPRDPPAAGGAGDERDDLLAARLRSSGPTAGLSVDFADVQAEVARRQRSRRGWTSVAASVATIAAIATGINLTARPTTVTTTSAVAEQARAGTAGAGAAAADAGAMALPSSPEAAKAAPLPPASVLCPQRGDEPLPPSTMEGFDPASALVPDVVPDTVVVCRYAGDTLQRVAAVQLVGTPDLLTRDLRSVRAGTPIATPCPKRLTIPDSVRAMLHTARGDVWLQASGDSCWRSATNGSFTTDASVAAALLRAADQGQWLGLHFQEGNPGDPCSVASTGQAGTDRELVPINATSVTVCRELLDGSPTQGRTIRSAIDAGRIIAAIDALKAAPLVGCTSRIPAGPTYWVRIGFSAGPDQLIAVNPRCQPQLTTDRLQADDPGSTVLAAIKAATGW